MTALRVCGLVLACILQAGMLNEVVVSAADPRDKFNQSSIGLRDLSELFGDVEILRRLGNNVATMIANRLGTDGEQLQLLDVLKLRQMLMNEMRENKASQQQLEQKLKLTVKQQLLIVEHEYTIESLVESIENLIDDLRVDSELGDNVMMNYLIAKKPYYYDVQYREPHEKRMILERLNAHASMLKKLIENNMDKPVKLLVTMLPDFSIAKPKPEPKPEPEPKPKPEVQRLSVLFGDVKILRRLGRNVTAMMAKQLGTVGGRLQLRDVLKLRQMLMNQMRENQASQEQLKKLKLTVEQQLMIVEYEYTIESLVENIENLIDDLRVDSELDNNVIMNYLIARKPYYYDVHYYDVRQPMILERLNEHASMLKKFIKHSNKPIKLLFALLPDYML